MILAILWLVNLTKISYAPTNLHMSVELLVRKEDGHSSCTVLCRILWLRGASGRTVECHVTIETVP